jgi:alpha-mannosidase
MITVHLVLNAHIDPVWLWPWQAGTDEVLATCRSACDRLDRHPDIVFTRGEAWTYNLVERIDPGLFERIRAHVAAGRWEIAGGWWVQPDCNQPTGFGLARQIELGREYFLSRFGIFPRVGFNVDSFGHAASVPRIMREHGQDRYVMMHPQEHEMNLPARVFRWRGKEGEDSIVTFRIAMMYATFDVSEDHILSSLNDLPPGLSHTMCFVGLGDHGGGPTERQIEWCRAHAQAFPGCRLVFSSPSRFFDAVEAATQDLPLVTGELHHHAVGCYSVMRPIKVAMRRAELQLQQAEIAAALDPRPDPNVEVRLRDAWRLVCFNQFHDTLGGTCIPTAYGQVMDQLGAAAATADEIMQLGLRRQLTMLADNPDPRIALLNASEWEFDWYVVLAPYAEQTWRHSWRIIDENGAAIPYQLMAPEGAAVAWGITRVLLRVAIAPRQIKILRIDRGFASGASESYASPAANTGPVELKSEAATVSLSERPRLQIGGHLLVAPELELLDDLTDTWSHGVSRLGEGPAEVAEWSDAVLIDDGRLMKSATQRGLIGRCDLLAEWRVFCDDPMVELLLRIHWHAEHSILKLTIPLDAFESHSDGVLGGVLRRPSDGKEYPIRDYTLLHFKDERELAIICPDVFALDASSDRLRLTLLRSPLMAHHVVFAPSTPFKTQDAMAVEPFPRAVHTDQGLHEFRFQFVGGTRIDVPSLEQRAAMINFPPISADWTKGMTSRRPW